MQEFDNTIALGAGPSHSLPIGTELNGYRITRILKQGGFGIVYQAETVSKRAREMAVRQLGARLGPSHQGPIVVAIKELFPSDFVSRVGTKVRARGSGPDSILEMDLSASEVYRQIVRLFVAESQNLTSQALDHPNILKGIELFQENETAYFVMEFIEGETLAVWLRRMRDATGRGPTESELRRMVVPLLTGLERLHTLDQMHRDIKPGNIMVRTTGDLVLIDFGLVGEGLNQIRRSELSSMTGTEHYAPPEQRGVTEATIDGRSISFRQQGCYTDIYALAAVLYFAVSGTLPGRAYDRVLAVSATPPRADPVTGASLAGRCSERLAAGILAGLTLDPKARPQSIAEFCHVLGWDPVAIPQPVIPKPGRDRDYDPARDRPTDIVNQADFGPKTGAAANSESKPVGRRALLGVAAGVLVLGTGAAGLQLSGMVDFLKLGGVRQGTGRQLIAVSGDGKLVAVGDADGRVRLLDPAGTPVRAVTTGPAAIAALTLSPDGRTLLAGSIDGTCWLIDLSSGTAPSAAAPFSTSQTPVTSLALDDRLVAIGYANGQLKIRQVSNATANVGSIAAIEAHQGPVTRLSISEIGGVLASGGEDGRIRIWDARRGAAVLDAQTQASPVLSLAMTPDGSRLLGGTADGAMTSFDVDTGKVRQRLAAVDGGVGVLAIARDASRFITGGNGRMASIWDMKAEALVGTIEGLPSALVAAAFGRDPTRAVALGEAGDVDLLDLGERRLIRQLA